MWNLIWLIIGLVAGFFIGSKAGINSTISKIRELTRLVSYHRSGQLKILQRELANILIRRDPLRFIETYKKAHEESEALKAAERSVLEAKFLLLTQKYPQYDDFNLIGTRDYVLYSDAVDFNSQEEIEQRYHDILIFQALQTKLEDNWPAFVTTADKELEHLQEYARRIIDTKFEHQLKRAMAEFQNFKKYAPDNYVTFEMPEFSVRHISHYAERRYGIHLKVTNEFGLCGVFVFDDGKEFKSYYRSDEEFKVETILDAGLTVDA